MNLCRRATAGSPAALDAVLRAFQEPVHRYLVRRLADHPDGADAAGDLRQEVLLRAAGALSRCHFESDQRVMAWVLSITRHVLVDYLRTERSRPRRVSLEGLELLAERASLAQWQSAPHLRAGGADLVDEVAARAMSGLPRQTVELFRLRVQLGCTWAEAGEALGTTAGGAKRRFQRAHVALRKRFLAVIDALPDAEREALLRYLGLRP